MKPDYQTTVENGRGQASQSENDQTQAGLSIPSLPGVNESTLSDADPSGSVQIPERTFSDVNAMDGTLIQNDPPSGSVGIISLSESEGKPVLPPDYELIHEVARGGMGIVYKVRQKRLNRVVALKTILPQMLADRMAIERFYQEARAAAALDHPNIVPIYEVGEHKNVHYFSMAFIEGESLRHRIKREHRLSVKDAIRLLIGIADGVGFAHQQGIIHRDLKPDNVLIDTQGRPRVTDFGLAKQVESNTGLTATGQVMGTPSYMSPEQALGGKRIIGPQTDVYALGAILYNMLTGRSPFDGDSVTEVLCKVVSDDPPPIRALNPEVPEAVEELYRKCLAKNPEDRFPDAAELRQALQALERTLENSATTPNLDLSRPEVKPFLHDTVIPSSTSFGTLSTMGTIQAPANSNTKRFVLPIIAAIVVGGVLGAILLLNQSKNKEVVTVDPINFKKNEDPQPSDNGNRVTINETPNPNPKEKIVASSNNAANPIQVEIMKPQKVDFKLEIELKHAKRGPDNVMRLPEGTPFECTIRSDQEAYVAVFSIDADGTSQQLFPHRNNKDHRVTPSKPLEIPGNAAAIEPEVSKGIDQLLVIASTKPWDPFQGGVESDYTIFNNLIELQKQISAQRGLRLKLKDKISEAVIPFRVEASKDKP